MLPDIQPGNTKILYFFNCLLDGMHTTMAYICDFSRYEKSSSMKRPTLKLLILTQLYKTQSRQNQQLLMSAFSNILLQSRSSEATNIGYRFSSRAVFGWILFELNSGCGNLGERVEDISFCPQIPSSCLIHLLQPQHRNHWGQWLRL